MAKDKIVKSSRLIKGLGKPVEGRFGLTYNREEEWIKIMDIGGGGEIMMSLGEAYGLYLMLKNILGIIVFEDNKILIDEAGESYLGEQIKKELK